MGFIQFTARMPEGMKQFDRIFGKVQNTLEDFTLVFKDLAKAFYEEEEKVLEAEGGEDNLTPFARLTPKYSDWKMKVSPGAKILYLSGDLWKSLTEEGAPGNITQIAEKEMILGTNLTVSGGKYGLGKLHQFGTKKMKARRPLRLTNRLKKKWTDITRRHLDPKNI